MNKIVVTGRFTKDIFLDESSSGVKFVKFSLAVKRRDQVDFFNCVAFNKRAETICKYCSKGSLVGVIGTMQSSKGKDNKIYWEICVDDIEFLNTKDTSKEDAEDQGRIAMREIDDDADLPF